MIRAATPADARGIAEVEARGWLWAYVDIVPAERLAAVDADELAGRWETAIDSGALDVVVYDLDGQVAGFAAVGPPAYGSPGPEFGELSSLYVDPAAQGAGVGGELHTRALELLGGRGYATAVLWVFRDNGHARGFYLARGWAVEEGSEARANPAWSAPSLRMRRALPGRVSPDGGTGTAG